MKAQKFVSSEAIERCRLEIVSLRVRAKKTTAGQVMNDLNNHADGMEHALSILRIGVVKG